MNGYESVSNCEVNELNLRIFSFFLSSFMVKWLFKCFYYTLLLYLLFAVVVVVVYFVSPTIIIVIIVPHRILVFYLDFKNFTFHLRFSLLVKPPNNWIYSLKFLSMLLCSQMWFLFHLKIIFCWSGKRVRKMVNVKKQLNCNENDI